MKNNARLGSWQDVHTVLSQQSKPELLLVPRTTIHRIHILGA